MDISTLGRMVGLRQDCRTRRWLDCRTEYSSSCRADVRRSPGKIEIHVLLVGSSTARSLVQFLWVTTFAFSLNLSANW